MIACTKNYGVAGDTADIETVPLLIIKLSLCPLPYVITNVLISTSFPVALSILLSYNMNRLISCKLTVGSLFMINLALL